MLLKRCQILELITKKLWVLDLRRPSPELARVIANCDLHCPFSDHHYNEDKKSPLPHASAEDIVYDDSLLRRLQPSAYSNIPCPLSSCQHCLLQCGCVRQPVTVCEPCREHITQESDPWVSSKETLSQRRRNSPEPLSALSVQVSTCKQTRLMCCCLGLFEVWTLRKYGRNTGNK